MSTRIYAESGGSWQAWQAWQAEVVQAVRTELRELFHSVHGDDFDWEAWRPYFDEGHEPHAAVQQALSTQARQVGLHRSESSSFEVISAMRIEVD